MARKKKDPARVAAGKKAWAKMSPAKKAAVKKRLAKFRFKKGGGSSTTRSPSKSSPQGGGTTGEPKKRKKVDPIPLIGVRGSSTKISLVKTAGVVIAAGTVAVASASRPSVLDELGTEGRPSSEDFDAATKAGMARLREIWDRHAGKILVGGGLVALFGKQFDRRFPDMPIRLGR